MTSDPLHESDGPAAQKAPARRRPAPTVRAARHAELRARIFATALELFRTRGVAATTIRQIAAEAGVGVGTVFNYFAGKEAVLAEIGRLRQQRVEARLSDPARADATARERVTDVLAALVEGMQEEPELSRAIIYGALTSPDLFHGERARFLILNQSLAGILRAGQARGEVAAEADVDAAAHLIIAIYIALTLDWAARASDYALGPTLNAHVETLWRGLASNHQPPGAGKDPDENLTT